MLQMVIFVPDQVQTALGTAIPQNLNIMSFEISQISQDGLQIAEIRNTIEGTRLQVLPGSGALWHGWLLEKEAKTINLINHYRDGQGLAAGLADSFKSAKLSPFACRIAEGKYAYRGTEYEFAHKFTDGNAIHGLLFDKVFREGGSGQDDQSAYMSFHYSYRKDDPGYPFEYDCTVTYTLRAGNRVTLETVISNISPETIPIVDGWHPYFTTGSIVDGCHLQFYANRLVEFDQNLIPTGRILPYDTFWKDRTIDDTQLDHSFLLDMEAPQPRCTFYDLEKEIRLSIYPDENYPVLQLYIPPDRRSIAIETLSGAPDAFNNGIGLILLAPGSRRTFSVTYEAAW